MTRNFFGLRCGPQAQIGLQLEVAAKKHGRQKQRQLKSVFVGGGEEAHRPVEVEAKAVRAEALQLADEAVELHEAQQLPVALRRLFADDDVDARRAQQHRLGQRDVVTLQQAFGGDILELRQPLFTFEIGEQTLIDGFRRQAEFRRNFRQNGRAVEDKGSRLLAPPGRDAEGGGAQLFGRRRRVHLELAAVLQQLGQSLMHELAGVVAERLALFVVQLAARLALTAAEHLQHPLGRLQPGGIGRVDVVGDDAIAGVADADHFAGEHGWMGLRPWMT